MTEMGKKTDFKFVVLYQNKKNTYISNAIEEVTLRGRKWWNNPTDGNQRMSE